MHKLFKKLLRDRSAATVIEYGMLIALISIILISSFQAFSNQLVNTYLIVTTFTNAAQAKEQGL